MDFAKYFHTLRYLTPTQLYFQVYYKLRTRLRNLIGYKPDYTKYRLGKRLLSKVAWIEKSNSYKGNSIFEFLNVGHCFSGSWDSPLYSDLWRYNLNYMDFLLQPSMTFEEGTRWIDCYINSMGNNCIVTDPYPISLRGINWIKFISRHYDSFSKEQLRRIDAALYSQYLVLLHSTEKHLMANHYLENGFSLLFAALYFDDKIFLRAAEKILYPQLEEQILPDGAHFELSPMYHCIILERLLDCYNIIDKDSHNDLSLFLSNKIKSMLGWLETVVMSDGNIPLLNDSALGIVATPNKLFVYAKSLGFVWDAMVLGASGYRKYKGETYDAFVDVAALGPSYNLGHSHADTFTFVMNVLGKPFIVDTGTSTYATGKRRFYERSTKAHNTVVVDGVNSSRVWGGFRCAQRAKVEILKESEKMIYASHNGYASHKTTLFRCFTASESTFTIVDEALCKKNKLKTVATFHLSPDVHVVFADEEKVITSLGTICFNGALSVSVEPAEVAVSYNILQPTMRISVSFKDRLTTNVLPQNRNEL